MKHPNLDAPLLALRSGRMSFQSFERRTRNVWAAVAQHILRRWKGPTAVSEEDVKQELLVHVWIFVAHWKPERETSITDYVVYNAYDKAKKWLHQQRNAYRRDDNSPARFDRPISTLSLSEHAEEHIFDAVASHPSPDDVLGGRRALELAALAHPHHAPAIVALARTGDVDLAAELVYQNPLLILPTVGHARRLVTDALHAVA